jgi:hypothetical protein
MTDPAVTAKQLADLARKHIEDQQCRIVRQRELMAKYERDDDLARLSEARRVLEKMQKLLAQMTAAHVAAEGHLATLTVDETSVEKVMRDTPIQPECVVEFAVCQQSGIGRDHGAAKLQHQTAVEIELENLVV